MDLSQISNTLQKTLYRWTEILFAYLHGSALSSPSPRDIDVAAFLSPERYRQYKRDGELTFGFIIPLEMELEKQLDRKIDFQVLNSAPLSFRYRVVKDGRLLIDKNTNIRCDFEYLTRVGYFDFRPRHEEYLQEIIS